MIKIEGGYYLFWSIVAVIFTIVMTASVVGFQYWLSNQEQSCSLPQASTITVEAIPITIELHEPIKEPFSQSQVHKWIDPENQLIHYVYPEGHTATILPMYKTVPPIWYNNLLEAYMTVHGEAMPQEVIQAIPYEWRMAVMPNPMIYDGSNIPPNSSGSN